jgi:hypothetical protein
MYTDAFFCLQPVHIDWHKVFVFDHLLLHVLHDDLIIPFEVGVHSKYFCVIVLKILCDQSVTEFSVFV